MNTSNRTARWMLFAALIAGGSYMSAVGMAQEGGLFTVWKGAGVTLLALYAAMVARRLDGWLLALVLAFGAAGDVLLEAAGLVPGALAFALGHLVAIWMYLRNRRDVETNTQRALGLALLGLTPLISWWLTGRLEVAFYALLLGAMAAAAWTSRFPRYRVGLGAVLFVVSDLLIFARMGPLAGMAFVSMLIWLFYFAGQAMIATGAVKQLLAADGLR